MSKRNEGRQSLLDQLEILLRSLTHLQAQLTPFSSEQLQSQERSAAQQLDADPGCVPDVAQFQQSLLRLQTQFQAMVSAAGSADINPQVEPAFVSYQTEAHRRVRLLSVAAMRLRAARQPQTIQQVCAQLTDHLAQLQQFAQGMMHLINESTADD